MENMKKIGVIALLVLLFSVSFVSAVSTTLKESYERKENILVEVNGNILSPIKFENIEFKRKNVPVPLEYDVLNVEDKHFIWAIAPDKNETYTLYINNLETTINGQKQIINYTQNFNVGVNLTDYSIRPGIVNTRADFEIEIISYIDSNIEIDTNFPYESKIDIKPGSNKYTFLTSSIKNDLFTSIKIGKYSVPLYLDLANSKTNVKKGGLYFEPVSIKRNVVLGDRPIYLISLKNYDNRSYENVKFDYNKQILFINPDKDFTIKSGENLEFNVTFRNNIDKEVNQKIHISYDGKTNDLPIDISIDSSGSLIAPKNSTSEFQYFCSELAGVKCISGEICSGEVKEGLDGACCLGSCQTQTVEEGDSSGIIGYVLALLIFLILGYLVYRFKKAKQEGNDEIAEKLGPSRLSKMKAAGIVEDKNERKDLP
jgi:hypothetical protein